jgi:hypothetical protein
MADFQIISRPFPNGGLQLKQDPALLDEGHYSELTNMVSIQEGDLAIRPGNQKLTGTSTFITTVSTVATTAAVIHSIAALRIGSQGVETLYVGEGQNIWANRTTLATMSTWVTVATGCAPTVAAGYYPRQRFSGSPYSAGSSGLPYEYFACPSKMLKSDGTTAALQKWGIDRPVQPAIIALGGQAGGILPANADLIMVPGGGILNGIGPTTITSFSGTAPGNIVVTPNNLYLHQIQVGMLMHIGAAPQYAVVLSVDPTTFTVNLGSTPTIGDTVATASLISILTGTDQAIPITPVTIDASYNGLPADGYSTNDLVHLGLTFSDITHYSKLSLRVYVGGSSVDYYEMLIIDPTDWAGSVARNKLHSGGPFTELNFPKNTFKAVGYAGTAPYSWKFVTGFDVVFSTYPGVGFTQVDLNCLYFSAVNGPNANATGGDTVAALTPYHYVYSFRNPITGAEGNPSVEQISTSWVTPLDQSVSVGCLGTTDPQITGANSIAVYRAGGAFADNFYRFVGYATNPGTATLVTFVDQQSDKNILVANTADFDNDPPVTSSLPTPLIMTSNTVVVAGTISTVTVTATSGNLASAHVGSNVTVGVNSSSQESAVIAGVNVTASTIDLFFQYAHSDAATNPITIQMNSVTGQPANLCVEAADAMFVAGDPNNPHVLYKSKTGRPEAFPILNFTTNIAQSINVGTPSDYIVNITEYNGGILCLNLNSIYYVRVISGIMETPLATPAQRGLLAKDAWCQIDNEIWYLSYDGVYSWSGGASQWRSAELDPLFKGYSVGPYGAIDIRPNLGHAGADVVTMESSGNEIFLSYQDTAGKPYRLRYHTKFNRWSIEQQTDPNIDPTLCAVTAQYNDKTTGILYLAKNPANIAHLYADNVGTSDGWSAAMTDGANIPYSFTPAAITMGAPSFNKTFADVNLEYRGLVDGLTLSCFYDFAATTTTPGDTFTLAATSGRTRAVVSLQNGFQKEAYAMQTRFAGASNQAWRFYSMTVNVVPLTQIQVGRAYDWDDLGWPYDKRLYQLVMEYDIPVGQTVVMNMDTMSGVIGVQAETSAVQTFTLSPPTSTTAGTPNRITANFALKDDMIVKKVRIRPSVTSVPFKHFSYSLPEFTKYPADTTLFTEWSDLGYPGDKVFRTLNLEMNSNGLPCVVQIQGDAGDLGNPHTVTTTLNDRARILTLESDLISKNTRLVMTPATGGYSQYFKHSFDFWKEPLAVTHWDSYEFNFGYNGYNFVKQAWLEYTCANPILVTFYGDYGELFYSITLPAHQQRDIERFYLPDYTMVAGKHSLNKSKRKRITIDVAPAPGVPS